MSDWCAGLMRWTGALDWCAGLVRLADATSAHPMTDESPNSLRISDSHWRVVRTLHRTDSNFVQ
ncbi:MAG: hypothetical protein CMI08_07995 [Oceanospirillaceae bacterium]|nr:hypothetical protein [Oceanospirillaceae bacterium]MAX99133.1 hypothetical protein [Oceanospirillaceae bacterium]MBL36207.1 hypothetical protein [Oceanospirillaceae bacterium]MBS55107.1 hypothetical protein [Oceanospirillaceae bacterium]